MGNTLNCNEIKNTKYSLLNIANVDSFYNYSFLNQARLKRTHIAATISLFRNLSCISIGGYHTSILDEQKDKQSGEPVSEFKAKDETNLNLSNCLSVINIQDWVGFIQSDLLNHPTIWGRRVLQISNGRWHSAVLFVDGSVIFFGGNNQGQCILSKVKKLRVIQVACGGHHSAVLHEDGTAVFFGRNDQGQCSLARCMNRDIAKVACGENHSAVLYKDGSVHFIGCNEHGQCAQLNATDRKAMQVICGKQHSTLVFDNGTALIMGVINPIL